MDRLFLPGWKCWCNALKGYCLHPSVPWEVVCIFGCIFSIDGFAQFEIVSASCIIVFLMLYTHQLFCTETAKHTSGTMWMAQQNVDECLAELHGAQAWTQIAFHCSGFFSNTLFQFRSYPPGDCSCCIVICIQVLLVSSPTVPFWSGL